MFGNADNAFFGWALRVKNSLLSDKIYIMHTLLTPTVLLSVTSLSL